jgi:hypothetical protein
MPTFSEAELEEIRHNTERIEKERAAKNAARTGDGSKATKAKKAAPRKKKDSNQTLQERLIAPLLLVLTLVISALVFFL